MYGPLRVVLSKPAPNIQRISVSGGGGHHPIGFWRVRDGKYYADLKSKEQWYQSVDNQTIANKDLGGFATQKELREFVMAYFKKNGS